MNTESAVVSPIARRNNSTAMIPATGMGLGGADVSVEHYLRMLTTVDTGPDNVFILPLFFL